MQSVAKATIIIPLIVVMIAGVMRLSNASYFAGQGRVNDVQTVSSPQTVLPTSRPILPFQSTQEQQSVTIDLNGPFACSYNDTKEDIKLFIENKNVYARFTQQEIASYFLLKEDCIYKWQGKEKSGIKVCNVGQYVSMLESLARMPFFSYDLLFSFIPQVQGFAETDISSETMSKVINSCEKLEVDSTFFEIPGTIDFVETAISPQEEDFLN